MQNYLISKKEEINKNMLEDIDKNIRFFDDKDNENGGSVSLEQKFCGSSEMIANYLGLEDASFSFIPQDLSVKKTEQKEKMKTEEVQIPEAEPADERFSF